MVVCSKCGSKLQYRKIFVLTNENTITCQVCSSRLRVRNKNVNSIIGLVGGGLGGGLGAFLLISWVLTSNVLYLILVPILFVTDILGALFFVDKYVEVELENSLKH